MQIKNKEYVIHGCDGVLPPCNFVAPNGHLDYTLVITLPCGCYIYTGDLDIAQKNNWPAVIEPNEDFVFNLFCVCGEFIYHGVSAAECQRESGWAYLFD